MNVVNSGSRYQIYGEDVKTYKELPLMSYDVEFSKMVGFYLTSRPDLMANETKIYGDHERKVEKVMQSFQLSDRNFGIILSGQKGIGKSLFARILAAKSIEAGLPVLTVTSYIPGIADFIASIEQEVVVIFDEFEKTFSSSEDFDPQTEMLSLFDGLNNGKKLFVITCNEVNKLNSYLLNRPGRIHYHFNLTNPTDSEIMEYMTDKLLPQYHSEITKIVNFSKTVNMTYDYLRAITFELNQGYSLQEALSDLNITRTSDVRFNVKVLTKDGRIYNGYNYHLDLYDKEPRWYHLDQESRTGRIVSRLHFQFRPSDINMINGQLKLDGSKCNIDVDEDDFWDLPENERADAVAREKANSIVEAIFTKTDISSINRYLAL